MVKKLRKEFNQKFSSEKYQLLLQEIKQQHGFIPDFRIAETPIFVPAYFKNKMIDTCESIIDFIRDEHFKNHTKNSIPKEFEIPNENDYPEMMVFDFGICENENGEPQPQMVEMQGFPSLYGFQLMIDFLFKKIYSLTGNVNSFLNGYDSDSYTALLREIIIGGHHPKHVILLEIEPKKQKTKIDFSCIEKLLGIKTVCLKNVFAENDELYYWDADEKIKIHRIFNRIVFDDLRQYDLKDCINLQIPYKVEWLPHPHWFYRISKYTLPFLEHPCIPPTYFLNEIKEPLPLEEYVLKPLFSYAGMGVLIDVTQADIDNIPDPENWILQKKVKYTDAIETPTGKAKAEIRLFYFWKKEWERPLAIHNLVRLSKGKMIGTRYNENQNWVGGTIAYFEV